MGIVSEYADQITIWSMAGPLGNGWSSTLLPVNEAELEW